MLLAAGCKGLDKRHVRNTEAAGDAGADEVSPEPEADADEVTPEPEADADAEMVRMINDAKQELIRGEFGNITGATCALFGLALAFNLLGDGLRDALDPKLNS